MAFENLLNPIFSPLLNLPTLWAVVLLSFLISFIITLLYKYTTNQNLMKQLKEEMKEFQKEIKELRKEPEKAMQVQKRAKQTNMKYMMQSMKSTLYSFIPIIIIFSWMTAHLAYDPILPGQDFTTTVTFEKNVNGMIELSVPKGITILTPLEEVVAAWQALPVGPLRTGCDPLRGADRLPLGRREHADEVSPDDNPRIREPPFFQFADRDER